MSGKSHAFWRRRSGVLFTLLFVSLAAGAAVAWEAARAARAERATAEAVLRDYAGFAAWQLARSTRQQLDSGTDRILSSLATAAQRHGVASALSAHGRADDCGCGGVPDGVRSYFQLTAEGSEWRTSGAAVPAGVRELVSGGDAAPPSGPPHLRTPTHFRVIDHQGQPAVVVWRTEQHEPDRRRVLHGFVADVAVLTPLLRAAETASPLLPPALVARAGSGRIVDARVQDDRGRTLYVSSELLSPYSSDVPLEARFGGLTVTAALAQASAPALIIGGLPASRLPWIYGLMAVAGVLLVIAIAQIRREMQLARLRSEFVSGVSHELRTPLAQIRMFAETLALGRVRSADESKRSLEIILQESQRLSQLVDNVLCFSRVERGMVALRPEPVDVRELLQQFADSVQPLMKSRRASLRLEAPSTLPARLDTGAVRQMLLNLVDNALKYGPAGQTVVAGVRDEGPDLRIWIEDEGPGIADEDLDRIWTPFWRAEGSAQGGSGIGLSIVRELAAAHGGRADVGRGDRGGARFTIVLPGVVLAEERPQPAALLRPA